MKTIDIQKLAEMIKSKRGSQGLRATAIEISKLGPPGKISSSTLNRIELGNLPDIDSYFLLCKWLGVSTDFFTTGKQEEQSTEKLVEAHLRADRALPKETVEALIQMIKFAYANGGKTNTQIG